jgi:alcohol dehydrogenase (NADP+)
MVDTYGAPYNVSGGNPEVSEDSQRPMKDSKGNQIFSQGGYSSHSRVHEQFVFPIPDNLPSEIVAPMMCAGLTVYSPLVRAGTGPGKKVAIVGIGGLVCSPISIPHLHENDNITFDLSVSVMKMC